MPRSPVPTSWPTHTVPDCTLDGERIALDAWPKLSSSDLARVVGRQSPGSALEDAQNWTWAFVELPLDALREATEDLEEPQEGWSATYSRYLANDARAVAEGSPAYAGRDAWIREVWGICPAIQPLFVVIELACRNEGRLNDGYRLLDGYHRLAGAFHHGLDRVAVLLGTPR